MRSLIVDIYIMVYRFTHIRPVAIVFALVYMTLLNLIMIYGSGLLLEGWLSFFSIVHKLYSFPYIVFTSLAVLGGTYWLMPPMQTIIKEAKKGANPLGIIAYTIFSLVLFIYIRVGDKIF